MRKERSASCTGFAGLDGIQEVGGSIPPGSIPRTNRNHLAFDASAYLMRMRYRRLRATFGPRSEQAEFPEAIQPASAAMQTAHAEQADQALRQVADPVG